MDIQRIGRLFIAAATLLTASACGGQGPERAEKEGGLASSPSPYLRMHADNPVDWRIWGQEALDTAKTRNELLIVSIGYTACHWCHVMEEESFMDSSVARIMNEHFVPIKVDREQRPAVDERFMKAAKLSTGRGGWPLNAIALPDGSPVMAVTYLPKGKWTRLLKRVKRQWERNPEKLRQQARKIARGVRSMSRPPELAKDSSFKAFFLDSLFQKGWLGKVDKVHGGGQGAPKFPMPTQYRFLMGYEALGGKERAGSIVHRALTGMARGGIYEHVGGGFHRYSTDTEWKVPHFEKMLYDNGQLIGLYSDAYLWSGRPLYRRIVEQSMRFMRSEMRADDGSFYSSLSAVVDGVEGKYYTWTFDQLRQVLSPKELKRFKKLFAVEKGGNWKDDRNVIHRKDPLSQVAKEMDLPLDTLLERKSAWAKKLREAREKRDRPMLDDKRISAWNGMMVSGAVRAFQALGKEAYLNLAERAAETFWEKGRSKAGPMVRTLGGDPRVGYLDDQAFMIRAYLDLYEASFRSKWLDRAKKLIGITLEHYGGKDVPFFRYQAPKGQEMKGTPDYQLQDGTTPSPNSVMAHQLFRMHQLLYKPEWKERSLDMLRRMRSTIAEHPVHHSNWARLALLQVHQPYQVAIVGSEALEKRAAMNPHYLPHAFFLGAKKEGDLELLQNKRVEGKTRIYVCRDRECKRPVTDVKKALDQLLGPK